MKTGTLEEHSQRSHIRYALFVLAALIAPAAPAVAKADQKGAEALMSGETRPSLYLTLPSELDVTDLKPLVNAYQRLPAAVTCVETRHGNAKLVAGL